MAPLLLPRGVSVASEARPIIAFYSRFRDICIYIYIYIYVCLQVHCARPCTPYASPITSAIVHWNTGCCSAHYFEESPFRSVWPTAPVQLKTARTTTTSSAVCVQLPDIGSAGTTTATWAVRVQLPDRRSAA